MEFNILGADISNNNGIRDLTTLKENGAEYLYLKATEGRTFRDKVSPARYTQAKELGLKVGFYHFLVHSSSPEEQAENFYEYIKDYESDLNPSLDVETLNGFTSYTLCNYVSRFIARFNQLCETELTIYTYTSFLEFLLPIQNQLAGMKLWIANYTSVYRDEFSGFFTNPIGWQNSENGWIGSFQGDTDYFIDKALIKEAVCGHWIAQDGKWWLAYNEGGYPKDQWQLVGDKWYYFDSEGYMLDNWQIDRGDWYFLGDENDGAMKTNQWVLYDKNNCWYYVGEDGKMFKGDWKQIDGEWYYFNDEGIMQTGWFISPYSGKLLLLYSTGQMAHDCEEYGYSFDSEGYATKLPESKEIENPEEIKDKPQE